mmetsp:Transcript_7494/g.8183  ORF Transcript_7494/g.8183 Transcript_7494/m.8183 type:complete len:122 (+) Transcript_7494:56-421(+)
MRPTQLNYFRVIFGRKEMREDGERRGWLRYFTGDSGADHEYHTKEVLLLVRLPSSLTEVPLVERRVYWDPQSSTSKKTIHCASQPPKSATATKPLPQTPSTSQTPKIPPTPPTNKPHSTNT